MTKRAVGGFKATQAEVLVALAHHKKRCWWLRNMTRRAVGGLGASLEEAFVVLEHTIRGVGGFGTSHEDVLVAFERGKLVAL